MDKRLRELLESVADCFVEINNRLSVLEAKVAKLEAFDNVQDEVIADLSRKIVDDGK